MGRYSSGGGGEGESGCVHILEKEAHCKDWERALFLGWDVN
jgi:hypothetical protein